MPLAADMSTPESELEFETVGDSLIVFLLKALPVLLRIKGLSILSVPKLILEVSFTSIDLQSLSVVLFLTQKF